MLSLIFLLFAAAHLAIWLWGWSAWAKAGRPRALFLVLFSGTLLWFDNVRIGTGRWIGEGELLEGMTRLAFIWHWTMLPLLVIAAGIIARTAGLKWAQSRFAIGAFCLVATALIALDVPKVLDFDFNLYVACVADTVRYTTNVPETALCNPGDPVVSGGLDAALVAILTNVIVLAVGIAVWIQRRWPWMALGAGFMFIAAGAFGSSPWSLPIANFGEIFITLGLVITALRFAPGRPLAASAAPRAAASASG